MCEFHERLIAAAVSFGAEQVRLERRGAGEHNSRFRSHPHLTGLVAARRFRFPVPLRPKDTRRWRNSVTKLRRLLIQLGGAPNRKVAASRGSTKGRPQKVYQFKRCQSNLKLPSAPLEPTRLSRDPWGPLRTLVLS